MNKEKLKKEAYELWVESISSKEHALEAEADLIELCLKHEFINEYINTLDENYDKSKA